MISLGIETSCDDTAVGIVDGSNILSQVKSSQDRVHAKWGGIVPELASRAHLENIIPVIDVAIRDAKISIKDIDIISCTYGPGLVGSLLVGIETAKALSLMWDKPLVGVNHLRGHVASAMLAHTEIELPSLGLLISGGHTEIIKFNPDFTLELIASTRDDAVGESLDKFGRVLGLAYPAGPEIDRMSFIGDSTKVAFPTVKLKDDSLDFSYSGLKTAGIRAIEKFPELPKEDLASSFMKAVTNQLLDRLMSATIRLKPRSIFAVGGVSASRYISSRLEKFCTTLGLPLRIPPPDLCTDNGAMIAYCGLLYYRFGIKSGLGLQPVSRLPLSSV
jgi:tRNA N6-adenosine threonylcarbamoyltransferase